MRAVVEMAQVKGFNVKYILGHSKGATVAIMYDAKHHDVPNIIALAPKYDWRTEQNPLILKLLPQIEETGEAVHSTPNHTYKIT